MPGKKRRRLSQDFALRAAYVIVNSGMRWSVAKRIWDRVRLALIETGKVGDSFRNVKKRNAIDEIVKQRSALFQHFEIAWNSGPEAVIAFCETLPYIGVVTKYHLAKNLGVDCAKPDVWLSRVAALSNENPHELCSRLSRISKDKIAVVDYVIWRSCQRGWWSIQHSVYDLHQQRK